MTPPDKVEELASRVWGIAAVLDNSSVIDRIAATNTSAEFLRFTETRD
jgi:hypothetical protein